MIDNFFQIIATVCDQGSNNLMALKTMGVHSDNPCFQIGNNGIVSIIDPPHLIKSTRNCLSNKSNSIQFEEEKCPRWEDIEYVYSRSCNDNFRMCPKLTEGHINVKNKLKVKLASQVLSRSVGTAIRYLYLSGMYVYYN